MTEFSSAPGFVKINYTISGITHHAKIHCFPVGDLVPGEEPNLSPKVGAPILFSTAVAAYVNVAKAMFFTDALFNDAEVWSQPTEDDDPIWIYTTSLAVAGTSVVATAVNRQVVLTLRTALGHLAKLYFMDVSGGFPNDTRETNPIANPVVDAIADYAIGASSWIIGKDNGSLVIPIAWQSKTSDALRKKRLFGV